MDCVFEFEIQRRRGEEKKFPFLYYVIYSMNINFEIRQYGNDIDSVHFVINIINFLSKPNGICVVSTPCIWPNAINFPMKKKIMNRSK